MPELDPVVRLLRLELPHPDLGDNRGHDARLVSRLEAALGTPPSVPLRVLRELGLGLAAWDYGLDAVLVHGPCGWEVTRVSRPGDLGKALALGVDLGSTSVVFYLIDPLTGEVLCTESRPNPQISHGEDILDRLVFAGKGSGLRVLQEEIIGLFNEVIPGLARVAGAGPHDVYFLAVAGNTSMGHFFLGLDPSHLYKEPYIPTSNRMGFVRARSLGLDVARGAWVYCFPNVGSYFGGDLVAGILASGMHLRSEISMLVDVGTNAEVVMGNSEWLVACAGAAGPALEGGILACGMRAGEGAVDRVTIDPASLKVSYRTIGDRPPVGICGSGIIDLLAAMFLAGLVDQTGKLVPQRDPERFRRIRGEWAYVLAGEGESGHGRPVYVTQSDIKNLIRSKGAMYTILNVVIQSVGVDFEDIERFYVAGAFGTYIDPRQAITIGMLPDIPLERFEGLGNAAGKGAVEVIRRKDALREVEGICEKITYLEMNVRGDFMNQLTGALFLPHTDISRFPSVAARLETIPRHP